MIHAKKLAGIGDRVARLRGALPARGWTAMIWHSRWFFVCIVIDAFGNFEALTEFKKFINGTLNGFESMHDHFFLPAVRNAEIEVFLNFVVVEFVRISLVVK